MKKVTAQHTRLASLNGLENTDKLRKSSSPFDEALKGLGVTQRRKESKKKKEKEEVSKV